MELTKHFYIEFSTTSNGDINHQMELIQKDSHPKNRMLPSGKHTKNYGTSPFLMGKVTINSINGHFQ
jgi:hypothetical protein